MHGLSYGPALTRNTKERASVYQSDKVASDHSCNLPSKKVFSSSMSIQHVFYSELSCRNSIQSYLEPFLASSCRAGLYLFFGFIKNLVRKKHCLSHLTIFFQDLGSFFFNIQENKEHITFLFVRRVGQYVRFFLPDDSVFLPCDHGLDFLHQLLCENSINQSINQINDKSKQPTLCDPRLLTRILLFLKKNHVVRTYLVRYYKAGRRSFRTKF